MSEIVIFGRFETEMQKKGIKMGLQEFYDKVTSDMQDDVLASGDKHLIKHWFDGLERQKQQLKERKNVIYSK